MRILLDEWAIRPRSGVGRYAAGLRWAMQSSAFEAHSITLFTSEELHPRSTRPDVPASWKRLVLPARKGFFRKSNEFDEALRRNSYDLYITADYLVNESIDFDTIFTLHDLTRIESAEFCPTKAELETEYGTGEWSELARRSDRFEDADKSASEEREIFRQWLDAETRRQIDRAIGVSIVSGATSAVAIDRYPKLNGKSRVIPPLHYVPLPSEDNQNFSQPVHSPYALSVVGSNRPHKDLRNTIEIIRLARERGSDMRLVVVFSSATAASGSDINAPGRASWVSAVVAPTDSDLLGLYVGATATIVSSRMEGFCLPAAESLRLGTEVVATDLLAIREATRDCAHYFTPGRPDEGLDALVDAQQRPLANRFAPQADENSIRRLGELMSVEPWSGF